MKYPINPSRNTTSTPEAVKKLSVRHIHFFPLYFGNKASAHPNITATSPLTNFVMGFTSLFIIGLLPIVRLRIFDFHIDHNPIRSGPANTPSYWLAVLGSAEGKSISIHRGAFRLNAVYNHTACNFRVGHVGNRHFPGFFVCSMLSARDENGAYTKQKYYFFHDDLIVMRLVDSF